MTCRMRMDKVYGALGEGSLPLLFRLQLGVHAIFCRGCAEEIKQLKAIRELRETDFFPQAPELADRIMQRICAEEIESPEAEQDFAQGVSFRSWVITGFIILISLSTSFFGMDFIKVAASQGSAFLLPIGLTIGCIVTGYGAVFIGSHLKELSDRFRLH